jgi:Activator of Hsp90 ATPase homolog 1-like protein
MIEPLRFSFHVDAPADHAFAVWTEWIGRWWPGDHTHTGLSELEIVLEARVGGRIFERTVDGREWDWGRIRVWEPPSRFVYSWHLKRTPEEATEVEIRFVPVARNATRVEIEHRGWERLGSEGQTWRDRNRGGWETLLPHYVGAVQAA